MNRRDFVKGAMACGMAMALGVKILTEDHKDVYFDGENFILCTAGTIEMGDGYYVLENSFSLLDEMDDLDRKKIRDGGWRCDDGENIYWDGPISNDPIPIGSVYAFINQNNKR